MLARKIQGDVGRFCRIGLLRSQEQSTVLKVMETKISIKEIVCANDTSDGQGPGFIYCVRIEYNRFQQGWIDAYLWRRDLDPRV